MEMMHITLAGSKFSSGTLPTMHSMYLYIDIYQGLKSFANSYIYIYILYDRLLNASVLFHDHLRFRFFDDLKCVAMTIMDRNRHRATAYEFLHPGRSSH